MSFITQEINDVSTALTQISTAEFFQVAISALLVYDALITMDLEVKYFWKKPFSFVNLLYFINRYIGILGVLLFLYCQFSMWSTYVANWISIASIDYILVVRTLALWSQDKIMSYVLKSLVVIVAATRLALSLKAQLHVSFIARDLTPSITLCSEDTNIQGQLLLPALVDWILPMVLGLVLMILSVYKAAEFWRISAGFKGFRLVKILVKDQVIYYLIVVLCSVFNITNFTIGVTNAFAGNLLFSLGNPAFMSLLGNHMLFNLKEAAEQGVNEGTNVRVPTLSNIEFI